MNLAQVNERILEIDEQIELLRAQARQIRDGERVNVIEEVRAKMSEYGITTTDLRLMRGPRAAADGAGVASQRAQRVVKYRSPAGETWSGGPGRKPKWVADVLAVGRSIEDFAV